MSATAAEPIAEPSSTASADPLSSPSPSADSSTPAPSLSDQPCATSYGVYEFHPGGATSPSLPSWVSASDGPVCVQLDGGSLTYPSETVTVTAEPSPSQEPSLPQSAQLEQLNTTATDLAGDVAALRVLSLASGGVLIFLLAALFMRSRKA